MHKYGFKDWDSILAAVGHGALKEGQVINKLIDEYEEEKSEKQTDMLKSIPDDTKEKASKGNARMELSLRAFMMLPCVFQSAAVRYQVMRLSALLQEEEAYRFTEQTASMCWVCQKATEQD